MTIKLEVTPADIKRALDFVPSVIRLEISECRCCIIWQALHRQLPEAKDIFVGPRDAFVDSTRFIPASDDDLKAFTFITYYPAKHWWLAEPQTLSLKSAEPLKSTEE